MRAILHLENDSARYNAVRAEIQQLLDQALDSKPADSAACLEGFCETLGTMITRSAIDWDDEQLGD